MRQITGAPIKFAGVSEKIDGLEVFDAERHAGRILGMGDIVALVEQVTAGVDMQAAEKFAAKMKSGSDFDLEDFLSQIQQMKNMGGLSSLIDKLPSEMAATDGQATTAGAPPAPDAQVAPVAKATGADARTIAELWAQKDRLANTVVSVRATVVKYNAAVMGKNWIHLQDGSGDAAKGTHDITVTTLDAVTVGATVTITGTVRLNRDVGAGYTYAVLVEDAKVVAK